MAFPTTPVLDSGVGTNGDDLHDHDPEWSLPPTGGVTLEIQDNAITGSASPANNANFRATTYGPDTENHCTIATKPANNEIVLLLMRGVQSGSLATADGYALRFGPVSGTDVFSLQSMTNGVQTTIGATITQEVTAGDGIGIDMIGSTLRAQYRSGSGGSWGQIGTDRTSTLYTAAGVIAAFSSGTTVRITNFGGGTVVNSTDLVVSDLAHGHTIDAPLLSTQILLAVADLLHAHGLDGVVLSTTGATSLTVADLLHAHQVDAVGLTTMTLLSVADARHGHTIDAPSLSTQVLLAVADALHGHVLDAVTLDTTGATNLTVADLLHAHQVDAVGLTTMTLLVVADARHGHTIDAPALSTQVLLAVADALHGHVLDAVTLDTTGATNLTVADLLHAHQLDAVGLSMQALLDVADLLHGHLADAVTLTLPDGSVLIIAAARRLGGAGAVQTTRRGAALSTSRR